MTSTEEQHGIVAQVARMGDKLLSTLPPAFLLLVLINILFLGMVMWFLNSQMAQRTAMIEKFADRCMEIALRAQPPGK